MANIYLTVTVRCCLERWSGPSGDAEMVLQMEADDAPSLECTDALQKTIKVALSNLTEAWLKKEAEEDEAD